MPRRGGQRQQSGAKESCTLALVAALQHAMQYARERMGPHATGIQYKCQEAGMQRTVQEKVATSSTAAIAPAPASTTACTCPSAPPLCGRQQQPLPEALWWKGHTMNSAKWSKEGLTHRGSYAL